MRSFLTFALTAAALSLLALPAPKAQASIIGTIQVNMHHPFVAGTTVLSPGKYDFRMVNNTDNQVMKVTNDNTLNSIFVMVRPAIDSHTPQNSQLWFARYGDTQFLNHIYEVGSPNGVAVLDSHHLEARMLEARQPSRRHGIQLRQ